jgi:hypothetical protein
MGKKEYKVTGIHKSLHSIFPVSYFALGSFTYFVANTAVM